MAIEIVKDGCKKFNMTCPNCGCKFTYEYEDVKVGVVICPCCKTGLMHKGVGRTEPYIPPNGYKIRDGLNKPLPSRLTTSDYWSGCEGCPNNPKYLKTPYVGDSPCQFCTKNPNKITCTSGGSNV